MLGPRPVATLVAAVLAAAGCGRQLMIEPDHGAADGGATEAGAANDASDGGAAGDAPGDEIASADAGAGNLAPDVNACQGWTGFRSTVTPDPNPNDGHTTTACLVCVSGGANGYGLDLFLPISATGTYSGALWVHSAAGSPAAPQMINVVLRTYDTDAGTPIEANGSQVTAVTSTWQKLSTSLVVTRPASHLEFYLFSDMAAAGECVLVSDATLVLH